MAADEIPLGTVRTVRRFALLPVFVTDRAHWWDVTWFAYYRERQEYASSDDPWSAVAPAWRTVSRHADE